MINEVLYSDKWWKKFNKLSKSDKIVVIKTIIANEIDKALLRHLPEQTIFGMEMKVNSLYNGYVKELDEMVQGSADWNAIVERLLSEIREGRLAYVQHYENMMKNKE